MVACKVKEKINMTLTQWHKTINNIAREHSAPELLRFYRVFISLLARNTAAARIAPSANFAIGTLSSPSNPDICITPY